MDVADTVVTALLAFFAGAIYDALNVGFMHASEKGRPVAAGFFSMLVGGAALTGFWGAIHTPSAIPFLLAGYFVGSWAAVKWKARKKDRP